MKITQFTTNNLGVIRNDLEKALAEVAEKHGILIKDETGTRYHTDHWTVKSLLAV